MDNQVPRTPRVLVQRNHDDGNDRLWDDYFADQPVFPPSLFRRRFCMKKHVFLRITQTLEERHEFFQQCPDATGRLGASSLQKCTATMRLLAYGRSNDINVLDRSPLFTDVFEGRAPPINCVVNGHQYNMGYSHLWYIPKMGGIHSHGIPPQNEKEGLFAKLQESRRKDVDLQARFAIIRQPALARNTSMLGKIMIACVIINNMIVEDERDTYLNYKEPSEYDQAVEQPSSSNRKNNGEPFQFNNGAERIENLDTYMSNRVRVHDKLMHRDLK
ncbi:uncharacterized protein [Spinacia oleracea]|uniref:DDE Tnp4 domain-containing protein n=1 Tax=Spinacia oleracea TaxID=3562 RepID=A0A9R0J4I6_SPIOL|nr:uncharacterized protein LOC110800257 [Spinacia oleracea]